jgi:hypothetical protein
VAVKLRLHNPHLIRALLFRVTLGPVPATGGVRPVYQEVLADGDVEGLTPAEETTNGGLLPFPREAGVPLADGQVDEAFHFQVWVSSGSGAFQSCPTATGKPELQFGRQVHDRFRPGEREIGRRLALVQGETRQLVIARKLRREATEKEAAVPNHTVRPYHLHLMAGAPLARVREILSEAAHAHLPFTEALVAVARPVEPTHAE